MITSNDVALGAAFASFRGLPAQHRYNGSPAAEI
jgi:hypothetical protein